MLVTIDLWPDDWAASLRTAGRTFRLPLQMLDILPAPVLGCGAYAPCCERTSNGDWNREVVQRTEGLWLHPARRWRQGRVRAHQRRRALRHAQPRRRSEGRLRASGGPAHGQGVRGQPEERLI